MTRDDAEKALQIARNALQEVGGDPEFLLPAPLDDDVTWSLIYFGDPLAPDGYRAMALGIAAVAPNYQGFCLAHWLDQQLAACERISATDAARGVTSCGAAA